jgi:hypothetical protein
MKKKKINNQISVVDGKSTKIDWLVFNTTNLQRPKRGNLMAKYDRITPRDDNGQHEFSSSLFQQIYLPIQTQIWSWINQCKYMYHN